LGRNHAETQGPVRALKLVIRHGDADQEAEDAAAWYEARNPDAASRFVTELERTLERISVAPLQFPRISKSIRFAVLHDFPYLVIFRDAPDAIRILAIAHGKRRRNYWAKRKF